MSDILRVRLEPGVKDRVSWKLNNTGQYTTQSMYRSITHGGILSKVDEGIWKSKLPMKIKVFLWQMHHGKLQAAAVLKRRGWK